MLSKGQKTQERIIHAATKAFGKAGYFDASLDHIAKLAGTQRPAIINYFGNKLGLYRACVRYAMARVAEDFQARQTPSDSALRRLDIQFEVNLNLAIERLDHLKLIVLMYYTAASDPEMRKLYLDTLKGIRERYAGVLAALVREGALPEETDVCLYGSLLHEAIIGMFVNLVAHELRPTEVRAVRKKWEKLKSRLLGLKSPMR